MLIDLQPVDQEVQQQVSKVPTLVITRMALKLRTLLGRVDRFRMRSMVYNCSHRSHHTLIDGCDTMDTDRVFVLCHPDKHRTMITGTLIALVL